ncbi:MAG: DUF1800 domain-containing protein [Saprospiraceae bacterium]|nr:DUF1800 domain-containing protein [Saprospiraceae bacterium]
MNQKRFTLNSNPKDESSPAMMPSRAAALPIMGGLDPFSGTWNYATAAHLLRRAMFGPTHAQINQAVSDGLNKTLDKLMQPTPEPAPPLNYGFAQDVSAPVGETWVDKPGDPTIQGLFQSRDNSLHAWIMENIFNEGVSLTEKMMLFWHNHFVVSDVLIHGTNTIILQRLRKNVLGNFKTLTEEITIDAAMLVYLNGNQNTNRAPNENYARELMELFTCGKGQLVGPGDYTTYTEKDIAAVAKVLTGWTIARDRNLGTYNVQFVANLHDTSTKTLSNRFNNASISNKGSNEYKEIINLLFQKRETATFICRKLYRYFVYYQVDLAIENEIVNGLADLLIADNFNISTVVRKLLSSDHFYSSEALGAMIRPPYEFLFNTLKTMSFTPPTTLAEKYNTYLFFYRGSANLQQVYFDVPSVAGWTPYYQEPGFHEIWINSVTLPARVTWTSGLITKLRIRNVTGLFGLDLVAYVGTFAGPYKCKKFDSRYRRTSTTKTYIFKSV